MDTIQAIFTRHSISSLRPDPITNDLVERLLSAAVQAPNHYKVAPWRFIVLTGAARQRLGDVFAEILAESQPGLPAAALEKERAKPLRAPLLIAASVGQADDPRTVALENICAVAAACQNLLLAAHAEGLGGIWRTGTQANHPRVKSFLGLDPDLPLIAFLYIGYPAIPDQAFPERLSFEDRTRWLE